MSSLTLPDKPTLKDFQTYLAEMVRERGFDKETTPELFMLLLEECGELAKAARKHTSVKSDKTSEQLSLERELADVFIYLCIIANRFGIDLERAFREKEEVNKRRTWE